MQKFFQQLKTMPSIEPIIRVAQTVKSQLILGSSASFKNLITASLYEQLKGPLLIVTPTMLQANQTFEELSHWIDEVYVFPSEESMASEMAFVSPDVISRRVEVLDVLSQGKKAIIILPIAALRKHLIPVDIWKKRYIHAKIGENLPAQEDFIQQLIDMGYQREQMVATPGEFAIRGGIVDIYPLDQEYPIRMDLFDQEIDSIRRFEVETQRSLEVINEICILPAKELPIAKQDCIYALPKVKRIFEKSKKQSSSEEILQKIESYETHMMHCLTEQADAMDLIHWVEYLYPQQSSILDYADASSYLILDDYARILEKIRQLQKEDMEWQVHKLEEGKMISQLSLSLDCKEVLKQSSFHRTYFSLFQKGLGKLSLDHIHTLQQRSLTQFFSQMPLVKTETDRWKKQKMTVVMVAQTEQTARKMEQTFQDFHISCVRSTLDEVLKEQLNIVVGNIHHGFELPMDHFVLVTEKELYNRPQKRAIRSQKVSNAERLKSYSELAVGDYVVHVNHGIGCYKGMETLEINGVHQDYLSIYYQDGGKLFVPITQIKMVQKYISSDAKAPKLSKLGGTDWAKTKRKVASKVEEIADELIELYAKRDSEKGFAFSQDTSEQKEFEDAFPYTETDDQLRSISEIKKDMEKERPMDRLLVGDVGYGKTEVAMRAVFKAVMDGKQAAILVPTTILAEQHYDNFVQRFSDYPFKIGILSRFQTKKQLDETVDGLKKGQVDIVVGTHRLLSKDVEFLDLGLLVVDEEQRFGVRHKERLKQLKSQVDVLTLTATPIPRTLHMSMLGVRDLSVIETPPANRYPVQTYVMEQDALTIKAGIERELARGGQVFYLYNRVEDIEQKATWLKELVPDLRVAVAHGQMNESTLENILYEFIEGEYDVLVTTTIVETGVDIPNVNTLFIEHADRFGLSQLYQLRGRVGRTNRVAYAYLMYQPNKTLSDDSEKRLHAMKEFTELGSGFKIAMRDLSIRGAGNLLGKQQHGFIDSVGFDLYSQMLEEAVSKKKGTTRQLEEVVEIDLEIDAYLPSAYIQDERQKVEFYKRIRSFHDEKDYDDILDDLIDRFGEFPDEVAHLVEIGMIKYYSDLAQISKIKRTHHSLMITFSPSGSQAIQGLSIFEALKDVALPAQVSAKGKNLQVLLNITNKSIDKWLKELKLFVKASHLIVLAQKESEGTL